MAETKSNTTTGSGEKPTLHHLNNSQSQRILWLLEELRLASLATSEPFSYNLVLHQRVESGPREHRAPDELKETHSLGKSPQLETGHPQKKTLVESAAIAKYLIDTYDMRGLFRTPPDDADEALRDEELTSFANASLTIPMFQDMFCDILVLRSPFFLRPIFRALQTQLRKTYSTGEYRTMFTYLNAQLEGRKFFGGSGGTGGGAGGAEGQDHYYPGRSDFMLIWPVEFITQRGYVDLGQKGFENVKAWHERCKSREAWKESIAKGNGFKLVF